MASPPTPRTWLMGDIPAFDEINDEVFDTVSWMLQPPTCKVFQTSSQSISNATLTAVNFQSEATDPYNWHSPTTNITRVTPTFSGWYRGWCHVLTSGATGGNFRYVDVRKNGGSSGERSRKDGKPVLANQSKGLIAPFFIDMNGTTDYLEMMFYQDSGSSMSLPVGTVNPPEMFVRWWGPL